MLIHSNMISIDTIVVMNDAVANWSSKPHALKISATTNGTINFVVFLINQTKAMLSEITSFVTTLESNATKKSITSSIANMYIAILSNHRYMNSQVSAEMNQTLLMSICLDRTI